jgi:hypothetical protein
MQDTDDLMSGLTFEQLRIPAALILIIVALFIFLPRGGDADPASLGAPIPPSSAAAGAPGGEVVLTPAPTPIPRATRAPAPAATATPKPTPRPVAAATSNNFRAEVLACLTVSGSNCIGGLGIVPGRLGSVTALVRFSGANAGDSINVILAGPGGTLTGGPFTLQGGGDGYYYTTFSIGGLPNGEYTLVAMRNGTEVAQTSFRRVGR